DVGAVGGEGVGVDALGVDDALEEDGVAAVGLDLELVGDRVVAGVREAAAGVYGLAVELDALGALHVPGDGGFLAGDAVGGRDVEADAGALAAADGDDAASVGVVGPGGEGELVAGAGAHDGRAVRARHVAQGAGVLEVRLAGVP